MTDDTFKEARNRWLDVLEALDATPVDHRVPLGFGIDKVFDGRQGRWVNLTIHCGNCRGFHTVQRLEQEWLDLPPSTIGTPCGEQFVDWPAVKRRVEERLQK